MIQIRVRSVFKASMQAIPKRSLEDRPRMIYYSCRLLIIAFVLSCVSYGVSAAPKAVSVQMDHYSGRWLEVARTPMLITNNCVAGYTIYKRASSVGDVRVEDGCYKNSPGGELRSVKGIGKIIDMNTSKSTLRVRYPFLITFKYIVIYKSPDKSWFVSSNPSMSNVWIYSRTVPSKGKLRTMMRKARQLGYDTSKLEIPRH